MCFRVHWYIKSWWFHLPTVSENRPGWSKLVWHFQDLHYVLLLLLVGQRGSIFSSVPSAWVAYCILLACSTGGDSKTRKTCSGCVKGNTVKCVGVAVCDVCVRAHACVCVCVCPRACAYAECDISDFQIRKLKKLRRRRTNLANVLKVKVIDGNMSIDVMHTSTVMRSWVP